MNTKRFSRYKNNSSMSSNNYCADMPPRIFDLLEYYNAHYGNKSCLFAYKQKGQWVKYSGKDIANMVETVSMSLIQLGVQKNDKVAIMVDSNPHWNVIDFAIQQVGGIVVPLHTNIGSADLAYIINHCKPKAFFVRDKGMIDKLVKANGGVCPEIIISIGQADKAIAYDHLTELVQGKPELREALKVAMKEVTPDDIATIVYTSGTTGEPKGVMLSHGNIVSNMAYNVDCVPRIDRAVSHLPLSHIFERWIQYIRIYCGIEIYYAENVATVLRDVQTLRANSFSTVPRVIEKMYEYFLQCGERKKGIKKKLFYKAVEIANKYDETGNSVGLGTKLKIAWIRRFLDEDIRNVFGGELVFITSGSASIKPHLVKFFSALGFPAEEGYGMTETSPTISSTNLPLGKIKAGSVGLPCGNLDVKIDEVTKEILVKGPSVMKGYYHDEEKTKAVFDSEGYFHTGDMGEFDDDGFLFIKGRINDMFKTSMGVFVVPASIEEKLCESPYISKALVVGEGQRFVASIIVPDFQLLSAWCKNQGMQFDSVEQMVEDTGVKKFMEKEVNACNATLGSKVRVRRFKLIGQDWTVENGELTPSYKVRRKVIMKNHEEMVASLFNV